tara:strand:+ start:794 stop:946 length:153 start_codon:yes stop_codon:yes gene_type:complete
MKRGYWGQPVSTSIQQLSCSKGGIEDGGIELPSAFWDYVQLSNLLKRQLQ